MGIANGRYGARLWENAWDEAAVRCVSRQDNWDAGWICFVARINIRAQSGPRSDIYVRRTYSGRPSSSIRFSEATAMATSVIKGQTQVGSAHGTNHLIGTRRAI